MTIKIAFLMVRAGEALKDIGSRNLYNNHASVKELYKNISQWTDIPVGQLLDEEIQAEIEAQHSIVAMRSIALHLALSELLSDAGVRPDLAVGLSLGFTSASCVAGVLTRRDAFLMHWQGRAVPESADEAVAACWLGADVDPEQLVEGRPYRVHVATDFGLSPDGQNRFVMFAGHTADLAALADGEPDIRFMMFPGTRALHTPLRQQGSELVRSYLSTVDVVDPAIPVTACLDPGLLVQSDQVKEALCGNQVRPVKAAYGMSELARSGAQLCISLGPTRVDGLMKFPCPVLRVADDDGIAAALAWLRNAETEQYRQLA